MLAPAVGAPGPQAPGTPESGAGGGSLHGVVRLGERLAGRRAHVRFYPDPSPAALPADAHTLADEMANVVVYLESAPALAGAANPRTGPFHMEQRQESFLPHVLPVVAGTSVAFPNADPIYHNVFSLSKAASFDLGRYPKGASRSVLFDRPGIVKVFCHIHADMSAVVMVLDHPFFAVPDRAGEFRIAGIPPGRYQLAGWHERARIIRQEVSIEAGRPTEVFVNIPLEEGADGR